MPSKVPRLTNRPDDAVELVNPMDHYIGYKLRRLQLAIIRELNEILASLGLRIVDFAILSAVESNPGIHQSGIAQMLGADPPAIVLAIDRLEGRKCLVRKMAEGDRRLRTLHLTAQGRNRLRSAKAQVEKQEAKIANAVDADFAGMDAGLNALMGLYELR